MKQKHIFFIILSVLLVPSFVKAEDGNFNTTKKLTYLCDEWDVAEKVSGGIYKTFKWRLTSDTTINSQKYVKIEKNHHYEGALREDDDANIYFVPSDSTKEFLLYAFHAQTGDVLTNLWVDRESNTILQINKATVSKIEATEPKTIVVNFEHKNRLEEEAGTGSWTISWIEGIGHLRGGPIGFEGCVGCTILDPEQIIVCAYKNGELVYKSEFAENIPTQATKWYGIFYYLPHGATNSLSITEITYSLGGDTIINNDKYRKILLNESAYSGAVRQSKDGQQVYFVPTGSKTEYLLYDLNVNPGDIVNAYVGFSDNSCAEAGFPATAAQEIKSVQIINGRKHVTTQNEDGYVVEWIEGIGTQNILWARGRGCIPTGMDFSATYTLCATDDEGNILYSFDTDHLGIHNEQCNWKPMAIDNIQSNTSTATRILRDGQIFIKRGEKEYTITGQEVR